MNVCICITESFCCTPETNTTLEINYTPTTFKKKKRKKRRKRKKNNMKRERKGRKRRGKKKGGGDGKRVHTNF